MTTAEALPLVREAMRAENDAICAQIGKRARGLMGDELGLEAEHVPELGRVGMLLPVVPAALLSLLETDAVPVIAPLARGPLNVNADDAAAVLAVALGAERLVFVSDVPGVFVGRPGGVATLRARDLRAEGPARRRDRSEAAGGRLCGAHGRQRPRRGDVGGGLTFQIEGSSLYFLKS